MSTIIDDQNRFIQIVWTGSYGFHLNHLRSVGKFKIIFRDSFRIFPISLNDLCKQFNVKGKTSEYLSDYNDLNIFNPTRENKYYWLNLQITLYKIL